MGMEHLEIGANKARKFGWKWFMGFVEASFLVVKLAGSFAALYLLYLMFPTEAMAIIKPLNTIASAFFQIIIFLCYLVIWSSFIWFISWVWNKKVQKHG